MSANSSTLATAATPADIAQFIQTPLAIIQTQLNQTAQTLLHSTPNAEAVAKELSQSNWTVELATRRLLGLDAKLGSAENKLPMIPSLNHLTSNDISHLRPNQLVRFRGMVQETFQPEYYFGLYLPTPAEAASGQQIKTGKYRDVLEIGPNEPNVDTRSPNSITLERLSINVVPIPGENQWVQAAAHKLEQQSGHKPTTVSSSTSSSAAGSAKKKRALESTEAEEKSEDASMDTTDANGSTIDSTVASAPDTKKGRSETASATSTATSSLTGAEEHGLEVIVTLYDDLANGERHPKVTQCFEFIGVLAINPDLAAELESVAAEDIGHDAWNLRRRKAIRIHALTASPIEPGFPFIVEPTKDAALFETQKQELKQVLTGVRSSLVEFLSTVLGGDALAGEILLLFLLQRLHSRGVGIAGKSSVGKLALNLIAPTIPNGVQPELGAKLQAVFDLLLPRSSKIDMNIESLNKQQWQPKKNYETDSLESNLLHLSSPTCLLLDETRLSPGQLNSVGITNLQVLSKLLQTSQLEYDFQYQALMFDVDWSVLLLSAGGRTLLQQEGTHGIDLHLKLAPTSVERLYGSSTDIPRPTDQQLDYFRAYLLCARQSAFQIAPEMSKAIEDHFVQLRQTRPKVTNEGTLHLLLNLARLYSLSHLDDSLSSHARWSEVTNFHEQLHQRNTTTNA